MDRLDHQEINELLKLIRNSANFANTVFIVAYDRNYLIEALKNMNSYSPYNYLEKIFQHELILPQIDKDIIPTQLKKEIPKYLKEKDQIEFKRIISIPENTLYNTFIFREYIITIRDAIRFSNSFIFIYQRLQTEVNLIDLFNLEVLKFKYPGVFNLIFKYNSKYLTTDSQNSKWGNNLSLKHSIIINDKGEESNNQKSKLEILLIDFPEKHGCSKSQVPQIISLIRNIFPYYDEMKEDPENLSIVYLENFERYLQYRLLKNDLSQNAFNKALEGDLENFKEKIDLWRSNNLYVQVTGKFESIKTIISKQQFEVCLHAMFYFNRKQSEPGESNVKIKNDKLYHFIESGKDYYKNQNFNSLILKILKSAPNPYLFDIEFINYLILFDVIPFFKSKKDAEDLQIFFFKEYLESIQNLDSYAWNMLYSIYGMSNNKQSQKINENIKSVFIKYIKEKFLIDFLNSSIKVDPWEKKKFALSGVIAKIFGSIDKFKDFLKAIKGDEFQPYINEFLKYCDEIPKAQGNYFEYNFTYIDPYKDI